MMKIPVVDIKTDYIPLVGGEDHITPTISVNPGRAMITQNYELDIQGRYQLIGGYEAFDGQPSPSDASYWLLNYDAGVVGLQGVSVGDTIDGAGGASGKVLDSVQLGGNVLLGTRYGYWVLYDVSGTFVDDEALTASAVPIGTVNGTASQRGATLDAADNAWYLAAIEQRRDEINPVPGSGDLLGVWQYNGVKYAFRNNAGGTAAVMYKSTTAGWVAVDLGYYLAFTSGGTTEISDGDTIEGETGGATAVVGRVVTKTGTWAGGDAAGYLILTSQTGTFESETVKVGANLNLATIASDSTAQTLNPDGRYEFVTKNFRGHTNTRRMYGCDGENKGFEFDGTSYVPIYTGMTDDTPTHLAVHKNQLFFMFSGGSLQHSSVGTPYIWDPITGAEEIGLGDEGTGFLQIPKALACFTRNKTFILYGSSVDDWDLQTLEDEAGAIEWSMQRIGSGVYLDDRGLTSLSAVQEYGDFASNVLSKYIQPALREKLSDVQCSMRVKDKNQYRLFFDDKSAITMTLDGNSVVGFTSQLYDVQPTCACSAENSSGKEELFFGSDDGYVYQMDKGGTFNGEPLPSLIKFHFNHLKSPRHNKGIRTISLELTAAINTYLQFSIEFDYGDSGNEAEIFLLDSPGGIYGINDWDAFIWSSGSTASQPLDIDGEGKNFSITIYNSGNFETVTGEESDELIVGFTLPGELSADTRQGATGADPHTIQGYVVEYDMRGLSR